MARYWQSTNFDGFFVEGNRQDRTIAEQLANALGGVDTKWIMGAGYYVWCDKGDPKLRVKDLADRTLVELMVKEAPVRKKAAPRTETETEEGEEHIAEEEILVETPEGLPPTGGELENLRMQVDGVLGSVYDRVDEMPPEFHTKLNLKLTQWRTPKAMAIVGGEPLGGVDGLDLEATAGRGGGGGIIGVLAILALVVVLGGGSFLLLSAENNDPYTIYMPGRQFVSEEHAIGFIHADTNELIIINVPTRLDTIWGLSPRFVRSEEDSIETNRFIAERVDDLTINRDRLESVILVPADPEDPSTASVLDVAALQWNRNEEWQDWFATEINRALVSGILVRMDDVLWLQAGENFIELMEWEFMTDEDHLRLQFAESMLHEVEIEVQFIESFRYGRERTSSSRRLFRGEIRKITILVEP